MHALANSNLQFYLQGKNNTLRLLICNCCNFGPMYLKFSIYTLIFESPFNVLIPSFFFFFLALELKFFF